MFEQMILGAIQGVTEWVPISSKACVIAAKVHLFKNTGSLNELINYALLLHLGTFFAAVIYFWKDIKAIFASAFNPKETEGDGRKILVFLLITTALTALGQLVINKVDALAYSAPRVKILITLLIASLLIVAGFLQLKTKTSGKRAPKDLTIMDGILLGLTQAIATLPGLSRAGTTMAILSLRNFDKENMLKLSFLMSLPVILIGNIIKNYKVFTSFGVEWVGVLTAFVVGIFSINALMAFARKVNFGAFLIFIGTILATAVLCGFID
jgi:undecaprenyl-diphosphatase